MSSGTQIELDWAGIEPPSPNDGYGGQGTSPANTPIRTGAGTGTYLTDEEILGIDSPSPNGGFGEQARNGEGNSAAATEPVGTQGKTPGSEDPGYSNPNATANAMPQWMQALAGDPKHGAEAQQLWQEHQAFRASFSSPEEARAIKELFPGGAQEAQTLKQASQSVDRIDAAIFSGDTRAQSEVVAELARANPAAFRSLFAEASKVLAGMGQPQPAPEAGTQQNSVTGHPPSPKDGLGGQGPGVNQDARVTGRQLPVTSHESQIAPPVTNHQSPVTSHQSPAFDPAAYASFERSTNDAVARDVRSTISDALTRVLPEGLSEGAARRIGDDIFNEIHRALAGDRTLSEQVGEALRAPLASGQGWRFGSAEQQRVAALLAGRARQLVPSVARRVIGEWTSSVLGTARTKAARQATAASRVDIAAAGGTLDSMPLRAMSPREVNYASMSDDDILSL